MRRSRKGPLVGDPDYMACLLAIAAILRPPTPSDETLCTWATCNPLVLPACQDIKSVSPLVGL
jgi:hypothetical protein